MATSDIERALGKLLTMDNEQYSLTERPDDLYRTHWIHCLSEHDRCAITALRAELDAQRREVARLTEDRERIEWLERRVVQRPLRAYGIKIRVMDGGDVRLYTSDSIVTEPTVREALDAAMRQDGEQ